MCREKYELVCFICDRWFKWQLQPWFMGRIKFYTQEIVLFRQDMLYRMRRSCLIPPSSEETNDPFEHVCFFSFINIKCPCLNFSSINKESYFFFVACHVWLAVDRHSNSSKWSLPIASHGATYYLELWPLFAFVPHTTHGTLLSLISIDNWMDGN